MTHYLRAIPQSGPARPVNALTLAGGWCWFTHVEILERGRPSEIVGVDELSAQELEPLTSLRPDIAGLSCDQPHVMGILNVTPDSFSDGGQHYDPQAAVDGALAMLGASIIDVGGESTRPGAAVVASDDEASRVAPVIGALRQAGYYGVISVDTRKAAVAKAAVAAGADLVNDVSGFTYDPELAPMCASEDLPVCVMHAQGSPETMQKAPKYDNVLLDVYDFLAAQIDTLAALGIPRARIIADPGIGFGKTLDHNLALLSRLSLFHGLGVALLLGASRKRFIGTIGGAEVASDRMPGSVAVALAALKQGTQFVRVHDVPETVQAIALWRAVVAGQANG